MVRGNAVRWLSVADQAPAETDDPVTVEMLPAGTWAPHTYILRGDKTEQYPGAAGNGGRMDDDPGMPAPQRPGPGQGVLVVRVEAFCVERDDCGHPGFSQHPGQQRRVSQFVHRDGDCARVLGEAGVPAVIALNAECLNPHNQN